MTTSTMRSQCDASKAGRRSQSSRFNTSLRIKGGFCKISSLDVSLSRKLGVRKYESVNRGSSPSQVTEKRDWRKIESKWWRERACWWNKGKDNKKRWSRIHGRSEQHPVTSRNFKYLATFRLRWRRTCFVMASILYVGSRYDYECPVQLTNLTHSSCVECRACRVYPGTPTWHGCAVVR